MAIDSPGSMKRLSRRVDPPTPKQLAQELINEDLRASAWWPRTLARLRAWLRKRFSSGTQAAAQSQPEQASIPSYEWNRHSPSLGDNVRQASGSNAAPLTQASERSVRQQVAELSIKDAQKILNEVLEEIHRHKTLQTAYAEKRLPVVEELLRRTGPQEVARMPGEDRRNFASNNPYGEAYRRQWGQEVQAGQTPLGGPIDHESAQAIMAAEARQYRARTEPSQTDPDQAWTAQAGPAAQEPTLPAYSEQAASWERPSDALVAAVNQDAQDRLNWAADRRAYEQALALSVALQGSDFQAPPQPNVAQPQSHPGAGDPSLNQARGQYQPQAPPTHADTSLGIRPLGNPVAGPANSSLSQLDMHAVRASPSRDSNGLGLSRSPEVRRPMGQQGRQGRRS